MADTCREAACKKPTRSCREDLLNNSVFEYPGAFISQVNKNIMSNKNETHMDRLCLNCGGRYGLHNHMNQRCPRNINAPNDHTEYRESVFAPKPLSSPIDEQLRELGYDPEKIEMRATVLIKTLKENIELKVALKKEEQDHYYTRVAWDRTCAERESIKKQKEELLQALQIAEELIPKEGYLYNIIISAIKKIITPKTKDNENL